MGWCRVVGPRGLCRPLDEKQATNKQPGPIRRANTGQGRGQGTGGRAGQQRTGTAHRAQGTGHRAPGTGHRAPGTGHGAEGQRGSGAAGHGGGPTLVHLQVVKGWGPLFICKGWGFLPRQVVRGWARGRGQHGARGTGQGAGGRGQGAGGRGQGRAGAGAGAGAGQGRAGKKTPMDNGLTSA